MSPLAAAIEQTIRTRRLFRAGQPILVAVSGGVDSMVLLHVLKELTPVFKWRLFVAHLNHQLRGRSSNLDEALVRKTASKLKLTLRTEQADVRTYARHHKLSLEMAARDLRHQFLAQTAAHLRVRQLALAHHADDQVEIFFLRLLRGSGSQGMVGMQWQNPSPFDQKLHLVRPLLNQSKSALLDYAAAQQVPFREDATNRSLDIQRNRIRHQLLPLLRRHYQPALNKTVLRTMELIGAESDFVGALARQWLAKNRKGPDKESAFDQLPIPLRRRILQLQLLSLGVTPEFDLIEHLRTQPQRPVCARRPAGVTAGVPFPVSRDVNGIVRLENSKTPAFSEDHIKVHLDRSKGRTSFGGVTIKWSKQPFRGMAGSIRGSAGQERFDANLVGAPIILRHWRPGDRFQPSGMAQPVKLQDLFVNARIPRPQRHKLLIAAVENGEIFWVEGLRISERFKLTKGTIRCLHWRWQRF